MSGCDSLLRSMREQEQDFIKLHNTHRGHKKAPACCYGALTCIKEYISRNWILIVDTEHDLVYISAQQREGSSYRNILGLIFQMVGLQDTMCGILSPAYVGRVYAIHFHPRRVFGAS